jgi:hypothetical protein
MTECPTAWGAGVGGRGRPTHGGGGRPTLGGGVGLPQQIAYLTVIYTAASRLFSNFGNPLPKSIQVEEKELVRRRAKFSTTEMLLKGQ